jgi:hypothetical protein
MLEWEHRFILQHLANSHMNRRLRIFVFGSITAALTACTSLADNQIREMPPASQTPASTATIIWFPASATPSPQTFPTKAPTPEQRPGVGNILLSDDFSSAARWNTAVSDEATIDVSRDRLTIAVQSGVYAFSLRQDLTFSNFYAEITARPSLCKEQDEYGFLVRAIPAAAYRFALSCDGLARVERASVRTRILLQPPVLSGDVPPGAPGEVRLGIWAVGTDLRFFLNGRYQFSVTDKSYPSGTIGVFAYSQGDTPVTVTFSDLVVYDVSYLPSKKTP